VVWPTNNPASTSSEGDPRFNLLAQHSNDVWHRGPAEQHPRGGGPSSTTFARAFLRRAQTHTTFRAHRQHAGLERRHLCHKRWRWRSSGAAGDKSDDDDDDAGKQYCRCHSPSFILLLLPCIVPWCCESVCDRRALANPFFFPDRYQMHACVPLSRHLQSSDLQACTLNFCAIRPSKRTYIYTCGLSSFSHSASSDVPRLQWYLHLDRVSRLILVPDGSAVFLLNRGCKVS
jgi:hypothetical protein